MRRGGSVFSLIISLGLLLAALGPYRSGTAQFRLAAVSHERCIAPDGAGRDIPDPNSRHVGDCCVLCASSAHCGGDLLSLFATTSAQTRRDASAYALSAARDRTSPRAAREANGFAARAPPHVS